MSVADTDVGLKSALLAVETNTSPRLSPDGRTVGFVRTTDAGDAVWLHSAERDRPAVAHDGRSIRDLCWSRDGRWLVYRHAERGRETWTLAAYDTTTGQGFPLCEQVTEFWVSDVDVVCGVRVPDSRLTQLRRVRIDDPAPAPYGEPNPGYHRWLVDQQLQPRGGVRLSRGGAEIEVTGAGGVTRLPVTANALADLAVPGFSADGRVLYVLSSSEAPTHRVLAVDTETGAVSTLFAHPALDVGSYPIGPAGVWFNPVSGEPDMCSVFGAHLRQIPLDEGMAAALRGLTAGRATEPVVLDRSADDSVWLAGVVRDDGPLEYLRYHPGTGATTPLFVNRPDLAAFPLPRLTPIEYEATDGLRIDGYRLTPSEGPAPTIVIVHGGPAGRDYWRFHAEAQYLASLGFASLHLNFRGSRGRGRAFRLAGHGEWGGRMQQDLYDGVEFGVGQGLVDAERVGFMGGSYGGYAALQAATTRPDLVRCAIAISPQCDLVRLATNSPGFFGPIAGTLRRQLLGDADPAEAESLLAQRSPYHRLTGSCPPLLIAHGVRDTRIPVSEVDAFVARARDLGVPTTYLRFADEGHLIRSNPNRALLFNEIESFLERHVNGE